MDALQEALKEMEAEEAEQKALPTIICTIDGRGIKVSLENWTGVSGAMIETMYFEILKAVQAHRAQSLQAMRIAEQVKERANV